ncbi:MAG: oligopeptide/dipeptide ABC transporter ATP-binding protein [Geminicoccaceae bacterium]
MPQDPTIALEVEGLRRWYDLSPPWLERVVAGRPRQTLKAVDDVSFTVERGTTFAIVGESGCGKSTLAKLITGLQRPTTGEIRFAAGGAGDGRMRVQMIFQDPYASLNPRWTVRDVVAEPIRTLGLRMRGAPTDRRVDRLLEQVGLSHSDGTKYPHQFSGGQRQRISIARALATEPEFLVLDEPTSALDVSVQAQILNLMVELQQELGLTYLFISHNLAVIRHVASRVAVMYLGKIVEEAPVEELFAAPRHHYTRLLLDTVPDMEHPRRDREASAGEVPSPLAPPPGCTFHPRCAAMAPHCRLDAPQIRRIGQTLVSCHQPLVAPTRSVLGHRLPKEVIGAAC